MSVLPILWLLNSFCSLGSHLYSADQCLPLAAVSVDKVLFLGSSLQTPDFLCLAKQEHDVLIPPSHKLNKSHLAGRGTGH